MNKVMIEKEKMPEWAREVLIEEVRFINEYLKLLDEGNKR